MRIINLMDVWGKRRERVEGHGRHGVGERGDARGVERGDRERECDFGTSRDWNNDAYVSDDKYWK
jgi:hypothetical protein